MSSGNRSEKKFNAVVLGAGPGGYVCAIKLGQLGIKTAIVEKESLGGVCLNVGCIPSKALIHAGNFYDQIQHHAPALGIDVSVKGIDLSKLVQWKNGVVSKLTSGVGSLLKANKVEIIKGEAKFENPTTLAVKTNSGFEILTSKFFVIATGSRPVDIPGFEIDGKSILNSTHALDLTKAPKHIAVIGGGYIGLELGTYLSKVGSKISVLEGSSQLLSSMDQDCVMVVQKKLKARGVEIFTDARAKSYKKSGSNLALSFSQGGQEKSLTCDAVLVTVGRKPNSDTMALDKTGLKPNAQGFIVVDRTQRTSVSHIYAIGDVAGGMLLAHKASREGIVAAECIAGKKASFDTTLIPAVVFTDPEIASVGLTSSEASKAGFDPIEGQFPFAALGKALATGESEGFVKVVADRKTQRLLGFHAVGAHASAILGEAGLAMEMGAVLEDLALTIHAHPTLPEALMEAAEVALGHPIHIVNRKGV